MASDIICSSESVPQYQFVNVQDLDDLKNRKSQILARTHAVKQGLRTRAKRMQDNFQIVTPQQINKPSLRRRRTRLPQDPTITRIISPERLDPFDTLAADSSRLQFLLNHPSARQAGEPVFSINDKLSFQNFGTVFRYGLHDPALLNALLLTLTLAVVGNVDMECVGYKSKAIEYLNKKICDPKQAASEVTIRAILLLAGVESRLGLRSQVQIHLNGVLQLLSLCETEHVSLSDGLKRAIFWQDLNSALITGSVRVFNHNTFSELSWKRDPFLVSLYKLPPGFKARKDILGSELVVLLEDIHAFQCARDSDSFHCADPVSILHLDNQQAWTESKLFQLRKEVSGSHSLLDCCIIAAYLCEYTMFTSIWEASIIPSHCSSQLLRRLQDTASSDQWSEHEELLLWLIFVGGAFAAQSVTKSEYAVLLTGTYREQLEPLLGTWFELEKCLKRFIWSETAFRARFKAFWEETYSF